MPDQKKVVRGLVYCIGHHLCFSCGYYDPDNTRCQKDLMRDALALLKEQEPVEPNVEPALVSTFNVYSCGHCDTVFHLRRQKYCANCGRPVKWDA